MHVQTNNETIKLTISIDGPFPPVQPLNLRSILVVSGPQTIHPMFNCLSSDPVDWVSLLLCPCPNSMTQQRITGIDNNELGREIGGGHSSIESGADRGLGGIGTSTVRVVSAAMGRQSDDHEAEEWQCRRSLICQLPDQLRGDRVGRGVMLKVKVR